MNRFGKRRNFGPDALIFKIFPIIFGVAFLIIITSWIAFGVIGVNIMQNPEGVAEQAGRFVRIFMDAVGK